MPFITCKVNRHISREQETELKARMGKAIELVPGKSEQYLLLSFEPDSRLWLRGDDTQPMAYIDAAIFGKPNILDLRQRHHRPDKQKPLESRTLKKVCYSKRKAYLFRYCKPNKQGNPHKKRINGIYAGTTVRILFMFTTIAVK